VAFDHSQAVNLKMRKKPKTRRIVLDKRKVVSVKSLPPIEHKRFNYTDIKDRAGRYLAPKHMVTVNKGNQTVQVPATQYLDQINFLEKALKTIWRQEGLPQGLKQKNHGTPGFLGKGQSKATETSEQCGHSSWKQGWQSWPGTGGGGQAAKVFTS
jgi:hypothetical protein